MCIVLPSSCSKLFSAVDRSNCPTNRGSCQTRRYSKRSRKQHVHTIQITKKIDNSFLLQIINSNIPPVRPRVPRASCSNELYDLMESCWEEIALERPTFPKIKERLKKVIGNVGDNIVDVLLRRMEQYAADLELKVAEKTQQFMDEKNRSEQLLSQLLPK